MKKLLFIAAAASLGFACTGPKNALKSQTSSDGPTLEEFVNGPGVPVYREYVNYHIFRITTYSDDPTYGYTEGNPVKVGGVLNSEGPLNERRFLNALAGPDGEMITYERLGSCCNFKTPNSPYGVGLLDMYELRIEGHEEPVLIYINMYDAAPLQIPVGLSRKKF